MDAIQRCSAERKTIQKFLAPSRLYKAMRVGVWRGEVLLPSLLTPHPLKSISRFLHRLSDELYSKSTHFLLEFIQNADDNSYKWGVTPSLRLKLEDGRITIQCNELGFTEANVKAICRIGASTKKGKQGYIGKPFVVMAVSYRWANSTNRRERNRYGHGSCSQNTKQFLIASK